MLSNIKDILLYESGITTTKCSRCGIRRQIRDRMELRRDLCRCCVRERAGGTEVRDSHNINKETVAAHRQQQKYLCAVTGEWYNIDDLTETQVPVFDNRQDSGMWSATIPARVLDRPYVLEWAEEACEVNQAVKRRVEFDKKDRRRELRADRPGHPERHLQNYELKNNVYYGIPRNCRPNPSEKLIIYNKEQHQEHVSPRPDILDKSFSKKHDWGPSTSKHSGAVTAAGLIAHAHDEKTAAELSYPLRNKLISTERFNQTNGIWELHHDELTGWIETL